ncbi:SPOR domain-containing protein [Campylobacter sp. MIT 21-1685]|uniref:SPOR domain-containing protein n=1 Tax=unclassified Campylobacter TaxID=2593542 RepID=UPI00224AC49D|nr:MULTISPECIES: SPOR domain-containing protein [unclassified Campylobacter]MCX2682441.1 SPOR domain-containing protein [Campylobacter sp. MIT 21-1684]MCX2750846.1 SPOR domain-containing protein [Campylobacter sp. MIT 21-1682]MCX2806922.1 SPOR domain-containing protein [Campylobacter sp. MIT 21-1685]
MENNKNDFDDIILEKSNKSEKLKKILLRIIALIILFLVVMIVMKLINSNEQTAQNETLIPVEPVSIEQETNNSFENVPITENISAEDQFEALRRQIQKSNDEKQNTHDIQTQNNSEENLTSAEITQELTPSSPPSENLIPKTQTAETHITKSEVKENKKPEVKKEVAQEEKTNTKELFKNVEAKPINPDGLASGIYVQIFSVSNLDQKSRELASVKQKGYDYKLYKTTVNGKEITKVLIGPFDKTNIAEELAKIRKDIAKDAFSFTLK